MSVKIIGTNHLMLPSEIEDKIRKEKPDVIGVELCQTRLNALVNAVPQEIKVQDETIIGKISSAIREKAEKENIQYGQDMITASKFAITNNLPLVLVDRDIMEIRALLEKIPQGEQMGLMSELTQFQNESLTKEVNEQEVLTQLKSRYPIAFEFLITSRELYIVSQILKAMLKYDGKKIVVFLGEGHVNSIIKLLELKDETTTRN